MKKIITILLSAGIFTITYAQGKHSPKGDYGRNGQYTTESRRGHDRDDHDSYERHDNRNSYDHRNVSYANQRQIRIDRINREFNYKVMSIQQNRYMTNRQKRLAIHDAKNQRKMEIQMLSRQKIGYAKNGYGNYQNNGYGNRNDAYSR